MLLVVHAGAGRHDPQSEPALRAALADAARAGWAVLAAGASAACAVTAAVACLEDWPGVNAGTGSALTWDGVVEADACVVDGDGASGGVAAAPGVTNPVAVAAALLTEAQVAPTLSCGRVRPTLLAGDGARAWAAARGLAAAPDAAAAADWGVTDAARARWRAWRRAVEEEEGGATVVDGPPTDTVGAVAVDAAGRAAAAASSGGVPLCPGGRVGPAALAGAGAAAIDGRARGGDPPGASAATGVGEAVVRHRLAAAALDAMRSPAGAVGVSAVVRTCGEWGGSGPRPEAGVIAVRGAARGGRAEVVAAHGADALAFAVVTERGVQVHVLRRGVNGNDVVWGAVM